MLLAVAGVAGCGDERVASRAASEPARLELKRESNGRERPPYMGVTCRRPNSVRCDEIGLAVWLEKPAERLSARIAGAPLELRSPGEFVLGKGTGWEGYLHPAGLDDGPLRVSATSGGHWEGDPPVSAIVRLTAEYADGTSAERTLRIQLSPGWG